MAAGLALAAGCGSSADRPTGPADPAPSAASQPPAPVASETPRNARKPRHVRKPFDPVRDNGPVFVGWPKPKLAIVLTGRQDGYLEPCGCAGLDRMRGGLSRRRSMIDSLREKGWPLVVLDVGGISKRFGTQAMLKFRTSIEAMEETGYGAIGLGTNDLRFPATDLVALVAGESGKPTRFLSANVGLFGLDTRLLPQKRIIEATGLKLGVTSVLGKKFQREIHNPDLRMTDPETVLAPIVAELRPACDLTVLLAHATTEESIALARRFPEWDIVVTADGPPVPPNEPLRVEGVRAMVIQIGERVKDAVVLGIFDGPSVASRSAKAASLGSPGQEGATFAERKATIRYQKVPLDSRYPLSPKMKALMAGYLAEVRQLGLEGLGVRAGPHPRRAVLGGFVGAQKCADCHGAEHDIWRKTPHARATRTLMDLDPARHFDPECIACHVTGWHTQGFFPYESGYLGLDATPKLTAVGCEDCHGPGGRHAAAEAGTDEALRQTLRKAVAVTKNEAERRICPSCHDVTNSPDFEFETYWPDVAHSAEP